MLAKQRVNRREAIKRIASASIVPPCLLGSAYTQSFKSVGSRVERAIAQGDATGVAVAVVQGRRIVWEQGFGWADRETHVRTTPHTPFSLASLTKPFTATTIMTLVAEGKLSLDAPANAYLSESKIVGTNGDDGAVTVRLLGSHASGLPGMYESYDANEARLVPNADALIRAYGRLAYPPATCYEYSNIGFAALNAIALAVTQVEFGTLLDRKLLTPLGLKNTFFGSNTARWKSAATRYDPLGHAIPHYTTSTPASGELYASAHDLALFAVFNMRRPSQGQSAILDEALIHDMHRPVFTGPSGVATTFGWFRTQTASGVPCPFKSGGDPGVANRMCLAPSKDFACVVVTNQSNSWKLAYCVCDELMSNVLPDWKPLNESCDLPNTPFVATPSFKGVWQGTLQNDEANIPVHLSIDSDNSGSLAIGSHEGERISEMHSEGKALVGLCTGKITSPDVQRTGANALQVKLLPQNGQLLGRVFAVAGDPNFKNVRLPYILTLHRPYVGPFASR